MRGIEFDELIGFFVWAVIFIIGLFAVNRVKDREQRSIASGMVCLAMMGGPWLFLAVIGLAISGGHGLLPGLAYVGGITFVILALSALHGFSIYREKKKTRILSLVLIGIFSLWLYWLMFIQ